MTLSLLLKPLSAFETPLYIYVLDAAILPINYNSSHHNTPLIITLTGAKTPRIIRIAYTPTCANDS